MLSLRRLLLSFVLSLFAVSAMAQETVDDLLFAVRFNDPGTIETMLKAGFDVNTREKARGETLLMIAAREKSLKALSYLARHPKTDKEARASNGDTALMLAAFGGSLPAVKILVEAEAEVNQPGWTALHYGAASGSTEVVAYLLENHAYIDAEAPNGLTPLMMAVLFGKRAVVELLLEQGADAALRNQKGQTAMDLAKQNAREDLIEVLSTAVKR
ncbi:ankyrin repeat domain-containing protein [Undibacterium luofuense]|uniref:ankyrin repeat domain-containing protein n=1 Tax=Undibacterium luofuense TaxID=2828733 RepID=UPI0030EEADC5